MLPVNLQWIMAILIPSSRLLYEWLLSKIVSRMAGENRDTAEVLLNTGVLMKFGLYVAILLASANEFTVWCILIADLLLHLRACFQVTRLHTKNDTGNTEIENKLQKEVKNLILSEIIESLVPLSYATSFATAYYGPNATLIGNVRCNYFDFKEIEDVQHLFITMIQMLSLDLCGIIVTGATLWVSVKSTFLKNFVRF